jgi:hypothetical protein
MSGGGANVRKATQDGSNKLREVAQDPNGRWRGFASHTACIRFRDPRLIVEYKQEPEPTLDQMISF